MCSVRAMNSAGQCDERVPIFFVPRTFLPLIVIKCLHALLEISVCAPMHLLMDGTFVPFARKIYMEFAVYLMEMMQLLPTATGAFHARAQL